MTESDTTPLDRIEEFITAREGRDKTVAYATDAAGDWHTLDQRDLEAVCRANRGLARQVLRAGDTIIAAADEIQRATLRAAADDAAANSHHGTAIWLRARADTVGRKDPFGAATT